MSDLPASRASRLDASLGELLAQAPELEAAAVVSYDGLAMASALPPGMDEDRVAAMSAALLSLGEKAAQGLGRGDLSQVYVEGESGTVFLVSCDEEAVLVAVAAAGAKAGLMLFEVRRAASVVAHVLRDAPAAAPSQADPDSLADAEAAYAAHRAALVEAELAAQAATPDHQPAPFPPASPVLVPVESGPAAPVVAATYVPLESAPELGLAPWETAAPTESTWS